MKKKPRHVKVRRIGILTTRPSSMKPCAQCHNVVEDYQRCPGCHLIVYCSDQCRETHWPKHGEYCLTEAEEQQKLRKSNPEALVFSSEHICDFATPEFDVNWDNFLRVTRKKYSNTPHSVFDPFKQHPVTEDVINTTLPPVSPGSGFDGSDFPTLVHVALETLVRTALANSGSSTQASPVGAAQGNSHGQSRAAFWSSLKMLPTDQLMQFACYLLFGVPTTEEIEKRLPVPMPTLERLLPTLRERRVQSVDISDRARLAFLELLCLKEIDSGELSDSAIFTGFFTEFGIDAALMQEITEGSSSSSSEDENDLYEGNGSEDDDSSESDDEDEARLTLTQLRGVFQCSMVAMDQRNFVVAEKWLKCVCEESKLRMHAAREADESSSSSSSSSSSPSHSPPSFDPVLPPNSPFEYAESILSSSNGGFGLNGPLAPIALPLVKVDWSRHAYELRFVWLYLMALKNLGLVYLFQGSPGRACKVLEKCFRTWQKYLHPADRKNKRASFCKCCFWKRRLRADELKQDYGCFGMQYILYLNSLAFRVKGVKEQSRLEAERDLEEGSEDA
eukprot:TRINITY_DN421_c0_g2_i4.p1 TRINITY_DN421_c0_g2~~TRINITY_DN421_c0_g2_i4.p1  ORF type:complete len:561 (-),score=70.19 TRINITY_DN421_c0_g2_i4:65-1747(-)